MRIRVGVGLRVRVRVVMNFDVKVLDHCDLGCVKDYINTYLYVKFLYCTGMSQPKL